MDAATAWGQLSRDERSQAAEELILKEHITEADRELLRLWFVELAQGNKKLLAAIR